MNMNTKLKNILLCIKYPFLYPRNRWTGLHYTNNTIANRIHKIRTNNIVHLYGEVITYDKWQELINDLNNQVNDMPLLEETENHTIRVSDKKDKSSKLLELTESFIYNDKKFTISNTESTINIKVYDKDNVIYDNNFYIDDFTDITNISGVYFYVETVTTWLKQVIVRPKIIIVSTSNENVSSKYHSIEIPIRHFINTEITLLNCINRFLGIFHIIPSYTELDALDKGWRIRFGEDICKDIKHSLLHTYTRELKTNSKISYIKAYIKGIKFLYNYRITQIKEKYGSLRWYDEYTTQDIQKIIDKYEDISYNTCIVCGKPAVYRTTGWICPYCEEHVPENSYKVKIEDENKEFYKA